MASRAGLKRRESLRRILLNLPVEERKRIRATLIDQGVRINSTQKRLAPIGGQGKPRAPAPYLVNSIKSETGDQNTAAYFRVRGRATTKDPELTVILSAGNPVKGTTRSDAHLQEFGTSSNPAQPFFFPGFRAHKSEAKRAIKKAARDAIKDAVRKGRAGGGN